MPSLLRRNAAVLSTALTDLRGKIALLGCHGAGMTALREILTDLGHDLIGFDQVTLPDAERQSHSFSRRPWRWTTELANDTAMCVYSPAVHSDNDLLQQFIQSGVPTYSLHQALNKVFQRHHQICVAGTHGKSTTSAMLSWILDRSAHAPNYFVGAKLLHNGRSGRATPTATITRNNQPTRRRPAVIESCEFNRSFHRLSPSTIILTGLDRDHFDCFNNEQAENTAFLHFLNQPGSAGLIIHSADCERSSKLVKQSKCRSLTYSINAESGSNSEADFRVTRIDQRSSGVQFEIQFGGERISATAPVFGEHNIANSIAAIAGAVSQGVRLADAARDIRSFSGIKRRFEDRGTFRGMKLIDDYAHHPTAIRATLQAARQRFPHREILVCFEPHQLIRLTRLKNEFVDALALADMVYVLPVLAAREAASAAICHRESHNLINCLRTARTSAFFSPNLDHVVRTIDHSPNPNAVLLTMGAGRTHLIHDKLTDRLRRYSVA